ncbi:hypothetical protein H0H92_001420 [Tricholoma furcatifolium]|nr:hypothetical protein H0H92_001420 [Tricholoma furcatifolium]
MSADAVGPLDVRVVGQRCVVLREDIEADWDAGGAGILMNVLDFNLNRVRKVQVQAWGISGVQDEYEGKDGDEDGDEDENENENKEDSRSFPIFHEPDTLPPTYLFAPSQEVKSTLLYASTTRRFPSCCSWEDICICEDMFVVIKSDENRERVIEVFYIGSTGV